MIDLIVWYDFCMNKTESQSNVISRMSGKTKSRAMRAVKNMESLRDKKTYDRL